MATLVSSASYGGRQMKVDVWQTTNGSSANTSTIHWTLTTYGGSTSYYTTGPTTLTIAGGQRYYKGQTVWSAATFPAAAGSVSGSFTISHNADGSIAPINITLSTAIYYYAVKTDSMTMNLTSIARYFSSSPTITLASRTETSMTFNWRTSEACSGYTIHGATAKSASGLNTTSGSFTLTGLTNNKSYSIYGTFTRRDSGLNSNSGSTSQSTYQYPYVSSIGKSPLIIGESQTINLYNPLGRSVTVYMSNSTSGTSGALASGTTTGTSITLSPDATTLYNTIPNSQSTTAYYYCYYGNIYISNKSGTYQVTGNEKPIFTSSNFTFKDNKKAVTNITGQTMNEGWLVQSLSNLRISLNTLAEPQNGATIDQAIAYTYSIGGYTGDINGITRDTVTLKGLNLIGNQSLNVTVVDSRGLSTTVTKTVTFKPYNAPTISLSAKRQNNYGEAVDISAVFTAASVENLNGIKVQWEGASQSAYLVGSDTTFGAVTITSATATANGIDNSSPFEFIATITDKFGSRIQGVSQIQIGVPVVFIDYEQKGLGVNCFPKSDGIWVNDYKVPTFFRGTSAPPADLGDDGDVYFRIT